MSAAEQIAAFSCKFHPYAARLSHGVRCLNPVSGYTRTATHVWRLSSSYIRTVEGDSGFSGRIPLSREFDDWEQLYSLQLLGSDEFEHEPIDASTSSMGTEDGDRASVGTEDGDHVSTDNDGRLSTIPEEDDSDREPLSD